MPVAPRIVKDVSYVTRIYDASDFLWQAQSVAPRIVNDVSKVKVFNHDIHFTWQAQYLVMLVDDTCCSAHCK